MRTIHDYGALLIHLSAAKLVAITIKNVTSQSAVGVAYSSLTTIESIDGHHGECKMGRLELRFKESRTIIRANTQEYHSAIPSRTFASYHA